MDQLIPLAEVLLRSDEFSLEHHLFRGNYVQPESREAHGSSTPGRPPAPPNIRC